MRIQALLDLPRGVQGQVLAGNIPVPVAARYADEFRAVLGMAPLHSSEVLTLGQLR